MMMVWDFEETRTHNGEERPPHRHNGEQEYVSSVFDACKHMYVYLIVFATQNAYNGIECGHIHVQGVSSSTHLHEPSSSHHCRDMRRL